MDPMFEILENFPKQCKESLRLGEKVKNPSPKINKIVISGMGGSGIAGDLVKSYIDKIPVFVNKTYDLPDFVDEDTLSIVVSYSGKTEETLSSLKKSKEKNAYILGVSSNKDLGKKCDSFIKIPTGYPPRGAIGFLFLSIIGALEKLGVKKKPSEESLINSLEKIKEKKEKTETIAKKIKEKIPIVYAYDTFYPVAYRFKCQMNENAKSHAFSHYFPELDHNELTAYMSEPVDNLLCVILNDPDAQDQVKKRIDITKDLINLPVIKYDMQGENILEKIMTTIYFWDWVSYYHAKENDKDPMNNDIIDELKEKLS